MKSGATVFVCVPVSDVFAFVAEVRNIAFWASSVLDVEVFPNRGTGHGMQYRISSQLFGRRLVRTFEITDFEEERKIAYRSIGGEVQTSGVYDFVGYQGAAELTHESESEPADFYEEDGPALRGLMRRQAYTDSCNLRDLIEVRHRKRISDR